jgi:hypothetical protein
MVTDYMKMMGTGKRKMVVSVISHGAESDDFPGLVASRPDSGRNDRNSSRCGCQYLKWRR